MKLSLGSPFIIHLGEKLQPIKFMALFVTILLSLVISPFITYGHEIILGLTISIILLTAILSVSSNGTQFIIALILGTPPILLSLLAHDFTSQKLLLVSCLFRFVFFAFIIFTYLFYILTSKKITRDTLFGAISIYFLMGLAWMHLYSALEIIFPGSFQGVYEVGKSYSHDFLSNFMYFSYVTLSTLGYGDVTPISLPAKTFSILEAMFGQLYLAILIARLIGLHLVGKRGSLK